MSGSVSRRELLVSAAGGAMAMSVLTSDPSAASYGAVDLDPPKNLWDLPTPALVVDAEALDANLGKMAAFYKDKPTALRPHAKTHKCPVIAHRQMELGAIGICTAKVSEAEVMLEAGLTKILITSPVVTRDKIERVIALAKKSSDVEVVVDQAKNAGDFNVAAGAAGIKLGVLVDLNVGTDRTGIAMGPAAIDLVRQIYESPNLRFGGLQAYAGHVQHTVGWQYRRELSHATMRRAVELKAEIEKAGYEVPVLSGGGTGTYNIDCELESVTDVQVGSYPFMDVNYRNVGGRGGRIFDDFAPALFVLATAISQPKPGRITIDAGYKSFATDKEAPILRDIQGVSYRWAGDEHGILQFTNPSREIALGNKVLLLATHCDPTVNLYDQIYAFRGEMVEAVWPVAARGRSQ